MAVQSALRNHVELDSHRGGTHWKNIFLGSLICLAIQITFTLLGTGIGLATIGFENGEIPDAGIQVAAAVFAFIGIATSFFLGGYLTSSTANLRSKFDAALHGMASWALVTVAVVAFIGTRVVSPLGAMIGAAGLAAGSTTTASGIVDEISKLNPRLISDVHLLKGKIVTYFATNKNPNGFTEATAKHLKNTIEGKTIGPEKNALKQEVKEKVADVRRATGIASLFAFAGLLAGLVSAGFGGILGMGKKRLLIPKNNGRDSLRAA